MPEVNVESEGVWRIHLCQTSVQAEAVLNKLRSEGAWIKSITCNNVHIMIACVEFVKNES